MNAIKRNTKLLINSKATWKNAERPKSDSTVKSSKFMVNGWQFSKRPIMNYSSFLTNASLTYIPYMISSLPPIQVLMLIEFEPSYNRVRIDLKIKFVSSSNRAWIKLNGCQTKNAAFSKFLSIAFNNFMKNIFQN